MINKVSRNEQRIRRHKRVRRKISGTPECPRLCVFRSNANIEVQIIDDVAGNTLVSASSVNMKLENGGNIEAASKVGAEIAKRASEKISRRSYLIVVDISTQVVLRHLQKQLAKLA